MIRIAFWGLGSIAKRHIRNLYGILVEKNLKFEIDIIRHSNKIIEDLWLKDLICNVYIEQEIKLISSKKEIIYDVIFVTNPTSLHYNAIKAGAAIARNMFIEKPVFDCYNVNVSDLMLRKSGIYYVACPLRYTSVIQYIKKNIDIRDVYSARAISSSYLPDWRPQEDYRITYSAHKNMGGGVAIDLIHEWDYLTYLFGKPEQVFYVGGKFSGLEIDSDDLAVYIGKYSDKLVELHLDYFGKKTIRGLVLFTRKDTIMADIINGKITYLSGRKEIDLKEERDCYQKRELEHFWDMVDGKCNNDNNIENALDVLKIAKGFNDL